MQPGRAFDLPVYVWCMGQDDNIGDVVLRRRLLDELRPLGRLHVFLGDGASDAFVAALGLAADDRVCLRPAAWSRLVAAAAKQGPILCVGKPGELPVDGTRLWRSLRRLLLYRRVVGNGGLVWQLGIGARSQPSRLMPLFRLSFHYHQRIRWRDPVSQAHFGLGSIMPDWGFDDRGPARPDLVDAGELPRRSVALSLRGDRPEPGPAWIEGVRAFCRDAGLAPVVVTQVRRDRQRSRDLAVALAADLVDWEAETHAEQEMRLRQVYAGAALAVSDRLHVLVVASAEGAVPLCLLDRPEDKIGRHFDAIGYPDASIDLSGAPAEAIARHLQAALDRTEEARRAQTAAVAMIAEVGQDLRALVSSRMAA